MPIYLQMFPHRVEFLYPLQFRIAENGRIQCAVCPCSNSMTCGTSGSIIFKPWRAPRGEPGRLTMSDRFRVPATDLDNTEYFVCSSPFERISSEIPGISRCKMPRVASGVTSRKATPVPPVVKISEISFWSAHSCNCAAIFAASSGTIAVVTTDQFSSWQQRQSAGPDSSGRVPRAEESLTVKIATRIMVLLFDDTFQICRRFFRADESLESQWLCREPSSCHRS